LKDHKKYFLKKKVSFMGTNIFLLQKFHSVELKKKWLKNSGETKYYVKPLCCLHLMMKQTIFLVIRANVSRKQNSS